MHPPRQRIRALVEAPLCERSIVTLILLNADTLGLETVPELVARHGEWFTLGHHVILVAFIIEAAPKISAVAPRFKLYFGNGWNLFVLSVILMNPGRKSGFQNAEFLFSGYGEITQ